MITKAAVQVYREFNGNPNGYAQAVTPAQRAVLPERDWTLILDFIQDLYLVQQGLASPDYTARLERRLHDHCSGHEVIAALTGLANSGFHR
jgi:hypothetical protein